MCLASVVVCLVDSARSAGQYPLLLTVDAAAVDATTTVTSSVSIRVDRLMEENRRKRVTDALTYSGYANFFNALRTLPAIGTIELRARSVEIRYAHEQQDTTGRRLVLIATRPLFFLGGDPARSREGYELTVVELRFDAQGSVTGRMSGAARVKPSAAGPVLDDYSDTPVRLATRVTQP